MVAGRRFFCVSLSFSLNNRQQLPDLLKRCEEREQRYGELWYLNTDRMQERVEILVLICWIAGSYDSDLESQSAGMGYSQMLSASKKIRNLNNLLCFADMHVALLRETFSLYKKPIVQHR